MQILHWHLLFDLKEYCYILYKTSQLTGIFGKPNIRWINIMMPSNRSQCKYEHGPVSFKLLKCSLSELCGKCALLCTRGALHQIQAPIIKVSNLKQTSQAGVDDLEIRELLQILVHVSIYLAFQHILLKNQCKSFSAELPYHPWPPN